MLNLLAELQRLADLGSGMPSLTRLADTLGVTSSSTIHEALRDLNAAGKTKILRQGGGRMRLTVKIVASRQVLDGTVAVRGIGADDGGPSQRRCLRGNHLFLSAHKGNRICDACKSTEIFHGGGESYATAPVRSDQMYRPLRVAAFG